jgi:hypothetical protein
MFSNQAYHSQVLLTGVGVEKVKESEVVIMIQLETEDMYRSDREFLTWGDYERALVGHGTVSTRAKWRSYMSAC